MKKILLLSILGFFAGAFSIMPSFSQDTGKNSLKQAHVPYAFEQDLIEVMFEGESQVRIRNGNLIDLKYNALEGTDQILNTLSWHQWQRLSDVPEATIDSWEINGERNTGQDIYNLNNIYRLRIPEGNDTWEIAARLEALPGIYMARPVPKPMQLPNPPSYVSQQGYLNPATSNPSGVDAIWAWTQTGGTGTGVTVCDLEYSWNYNHADITKAVGSQLNTNLGIPSGTDNNHGTAVIGELVSDNNGWGTTGICYGSNLKTCGTYYGTPTPSWNVAGAMVIAMAALQAGDIMLLEQQWDYYSDGISFIPIEWWLNYNPGAQTNNAVYAAIVNAISIGIHVVEAGGNGNVNTGSLIWFGNSGAIIVGAGGATTTNNLKRIIPPTWGSSYGPRFDLQGWGENVFTTGYGTYYNSQGVNYYYRADFNGTSSASPIVAGALTCAEGIYLANISTIPPTPAFMRTALVNNGTAQVTPPTGNIGPRPNIKATVQNGFPPPATLDYGDAPDGPYPTLLASTGASHTNTGLRLGALIDSELNGQPNATATGDDINPVGAGDDEDGVIFAGPLIPGQIANIQVIASAPGILNAWVDFNKINVWGDPGEFIFQNFPLVAGPNLLAFPVPMGAMPGFTYARFRFSTQGGLLFYGTAQDGEVEDYQVFIEESIQYDWGDAPDGPYPTLSASIGANHMIMGNIFLGAMVDAEPNGQPDPIASGDDNNILNPPPNDDEDGVLFTSTFLPNQPASMTVTASTQAFLNVWFDFNNNGSWNDPGEQVFVDLVTTAGPNLLVFLVPGNAGPGPVFGRFRFSTQQGLGVTGSAPDGEVEDYMVVIENQEFDFGDAPDPSYPTLLGSNGARHINTGLILGTLIDVEPDGQPNATATGDDNNPPTGLDDEDGVWWGCNFVPGQANTVKVTASGPGVLNAWFDFNKDGDWADFGEQIFTNQTLGAGVNVLSISVPLNAALGNTFARFRFNSQGGLTYTGLANDGEVEDYQFVVEPAVPMDYGDAPDPTYPTLAASNGARHPQGSPVFMGNLVDAELDGQPNIFANGDIPDEDGVKFNSPLIPGLPCAVTISVSMTGPLLQGWIDFNSDGDWADPGEQILVNVNPPALVQVYNFVVPPNASLGKTYTRFRFSTMPNLSYDGCASNGEVEDYMIYIGEYDLGDAPDPAYPTKLASNGAIHRQTGLFMGVRIDAEADGQPNATATGDDINPAGFNDEDGVWWPCNFTPGHVNTVKVTVNGPGALNAWFDFNANGSWADPGEQVFNNVALVAGTTDLFVTVPANAVAGTTFARFRFGSQLNLGYSGLAADGEVEDYSITIQPAEPMDYGDAPDPTYPTLAASNGARHAHDLTMPVPIFLGNLIDWELNGQPTLNATGDDLNNLADEDGVVFNTPLIPGGVATITVVASIGGGAFQGWIDFNKDGDWTDAGEQIFNNTVLVAGPQLLNFNVPANILPGNTYARFRYSTMGNLAPYGCAPNGEVEDYMVIIGQIDFGDAPDPSYPTMLVNNGARHIIANNTFLGLVVDPEPNGQPDITATGDDNNPPGGLDDEDGVTFMWPLAKGIPCKLKVKASVGDALFNCWIDFNGNGSWAEANEHVFIDLNLLVGDNYLTFITPATATPGPTYARFRFSHQPALSYTGLAQDGEVEDYAIDLFQYTDRKWQQLPDPLLPGLHSGDMTYPADDWLCNGGVVTDIHWWGNYEMLSGIEKRGQGINHFVLNIYSNANCLPSTLLKSYSVPYIPAIEVNTGITNNEGSWIYKYDFMLPEPFIQVKGTKYWLSVQAVSNNPQNPPSWRWQEANRWLYPILCGAADFNGTIWQTITWPFGQLTKYDDFAFEITSWVLDNLYLQNIDVTNGQDNCYDANLVITVAGFGTTFTVQPGGKAHMIAGLRISYLPGTKVFSGGYMLGEITTTGKFCSSYKSSIAEAVLPEPYDQQTPELQTAGSSIKAYPNPTTGKLIVEMTDAAAASPAVIEIYGMMGDKVLREEFPQQSRYEISLVLQPSGVYILRIITGKETRTLKVIKQ